jgi:molybdopterin molybdotransferase
MTPRALRPIPADQARRLLCEAVRPVPAEEVPLAEAGGRVLARDVTAPEDLPALARAAMDGYAVRSADLVGASAARPARLKLAAPVLMGAPPGRPLEAEDAAPIPTGGLLPPGADAVVMVEQASLDGESVVVGQAIEPGRHVLQPGDDLRRGALVVRAGKRLGAGDVAALAAFGWVRVPVHRRPRVAVLSTGVEICPPGETPPPGKVRDVNQYGLAAGTAAAGCEVTLAGITEDDPAALERALAGAAAGHDAVLVSGGSSIGGRDHTAEVLTRLAPDGLLFHGVRTRPGRPTLAARLGDTLVIGIPGVPAAALTIFQMFVRPTLRWLGGEKDLRSVGRRARLVAPYASAEGREDYLRVRFVEREGELWAEALSGGLGSLVASDGLVIVGADDEALGAGEEVEVWPWS